MTDIDRIELEECPRCHGGNIDVTRQQGILAGSCGCLLTSMEVRVAADASKREVATL